MGNGHVLKTDFHIRSCLINVAALFIVMTTIFSMAPTEVQAQHAKNSGDSTSSRQARRPPGPLEIVNNGSCLGNQKGKIVSRFHAARSEFQFCSANTPASQDVLELTARTRFQCPERWPFIGTNVMLSVKVNSSFLLGKHHPRITVTAENAYFSVDIINETLHICDSQSVKKGKGYQRIYLHANRLKYAGGCLRFWRWMRGGCMAPPALNLDIKFFETGETGNHIPIPYEQVVQERECWKLMFLVVPKNGSANYWNSNLEVRGKIEDMCQTRSSTEPLPTVISPSGSSQTDYFPTPNSQNVSLPATSSTALEKSTESPVPETEKETEPPINCLEEKRPDSTSLSKYTLVEFLANGLTCNSTNECENEERSISYNSRKQCREANGGLSCHLLKTCKDGEGSLSYNSTKQNTNTGIKIHQDERTMVCRKTSGERSCKINELCKGAAGILHRSCRGRQCKKVNDALSCNSATQCRMRLRVIPQQQCRHGIYFSSRIDRPQVVLLLHLGEALRKLNMSFQVIVSHDEEGKKVLIDELVTICATSGEPFLALRPMATRISQITDFWQWLYVRCTRQAREEPQEVYITFKMHASGSVITPEEVWQDERKKLFSDVMMTVHYEIDPPQWFLNINCLSEHNVSYFAKYFVVSLCFIFRLKISDVFLLDCLLLIFFTELLLSVAFFIAFRRG